MTERMCAKTMVKRYGDSLIGKVVRTFPMGEWPGGLGEVTQLVSKDDPAIVMTVKPIDDQRDSDGEKFESMGVFEYENVELWEGPVD